MAEAAVVAIALVRGEAVLEAVVLRQERTLEQSASGGMGEPIVWEPGQASVRLDVPVAEAIWPEALGLPAGVAAGVAVMTVLLLQKMVEMAVQAMSGMLPMEQAVEVVLQVAVRRAVAVESGETEVFTVVAEERLAWVGVVTQPESGPKASS